jgi:ABC-2 type transport system permease protein
VTTTTTPTATTSARSSRLTFGGIFQSEWLKFWTLRSSYWCCAIVIVLVLGVALLIGLNSGPSQTIPSSAQQELVARDATGGLTIALLVVAVLGVLVISGEYGTGMIRSTMTVIPKRLPAFFGKALVLAIVAGILGLVSTYGTAFLEAPLISHSGIHGDFSSGKLTLSLLGGTAYIVLIALMAFGIGTIVRNGAAGITVALGLVLVVPIVLQLVGALTRTDWVLSVAAFLPSAAGSAMYSYNGPKTGLVGGVINLSANDGGLVMVGWAVLALVIAAILLRRRDV